MYKGRKTKITANLPSETSKLKNNNTIKVMKQKLSTQNSTSNKNIFKKEGKINTFQAKTEEIYCQHTYSTKNVEVLQTEIIHLAEN